MPWSLSKQWNIFRDRNFHLSAVNMSQEVAKQGPAVEEAELGKVRVRPFDKYLLVWSGKYKSREEVPERVARSTLLKSHSVCRVKVCNYMIGLTVIAAICYIISGKRDAEKGLTVAEMNRKWHREYNKKFEEENKKD